MSLRRLSPTANLLRTSRLFSLPPPLPRPAQDLSATSNYDSDTATTPYPTHAAIETYPSSLARGDWGLKRALPLKSTTKTSTPVIHIDNIDSIDHITDFDSAADHVLSLRKWQDLDMPLSLPETRTTVSDAQPPLRSVFDSRYDNTEASHRIPHSRSLKERWKFKGPWLAGKTEGEFNEYMEKKVKSRNSNFRRHLSERLAQRKAASLRREAVENGEDLKNSAVDQTQVSEEEVNDYILCLRDNEQDLHRLVEEYLDLPRKESEATGDVASQYYDKGPPTTHPSAGLSYLRTGSHIYNHPELGPQAHKAPVHARVVVPQKAKNRMNVQALVAVAGVVGKDNRKTFFIEKNSDIAKGVNSFDPDIRGGGKVWTQPRRANIDSHGRIELTLERADKYAFNVAMGVYSGQPNQEVADAAERDAPDLGPSSSKDRGKSLGYGLEDVEGVKSSMKATPFLGPDDEAPPEALHQLLRHGTIKSKK